MGLEDATRAHGRGIDGRDDRNIRCGKGWPNEAGDIQRISPSLSPPGAAPGPPHLHPAAPPARTLSCGLPIFSTLPVFPIFVIFPHACPLLPAGLQSRRRSKAAIFSSVSFDNRPFLGQYSDWRHRSECPLTSPAASALLSGGTLLGGHAVADAILSTAAVASANSCLWCARGSPGPPEWCRFFAGWLSRNMDESAEALTEGYCSASPSPKVP